ncbi:MAG TPA: hypothetical protein VGG56_00085 [Terracidiphilus sp.]|jgi:hypothetical protein
MNRKIASHIAKRLNRSFTLVPAIAILIAGCSSTLKGAAAASSGLGAAGAQAASGQKVGGARYVNSTALSNRMTTAPVTDPTLNNMVAVNMTIPAGWKLEGIEMMPPCTPFPFSAFRAHSPDGLMQMRQEPLVGWRWASSLKMNQSGCANISGVISAADFLKYYVGTMQGGVHVVGTMPVPAGYAQWAERMADQANQNASRWGPALRSQNSADTAALRVQVVNGTFIVEERLRAAVECAVNNTPKNSASPFMIGPHGACYARVDVLAAPQGKLDALVQLADSNDLPHWKGNPEWQQATMQQMTERNQRDGERRLAEGRAESQAFSNMMNNAFQQSMARSASQHAAFMQQQESSFRSSMNNANAAMNARSTAASDWVDYALDQQTVTGAGGTVKVSNAYSQTWSNGQGQWYQTNDTNANPNGVLQGNWTQTTVVHGNGQPK